MTIHQQRLRRQQLDRQLLPLRESLADSTYIRPPGGMLRTVRESLGMTLETFGKRLGVSRATAHQLERAEGNETITVKRLRAAANALECELIISIVPRKPLEETIVERAYEVARREVASVNHTMVLEAQAVYQSDDRDLIKQVAEDMIEHNDPRLWIPD